VHTTFAQQLIRLSLNLKHFVLHEVFDVKFKIANFTDFSPLLGKLIAQREWPSLVPTPAAEMKATEVTVHFFILCFKNFLAAITARSWLGRLRDLS